MSRQQFQERRSRQMMMNRSQRHVLITSHTTNETLRSNIALALPAFSSLGVSDAWVCTFNPRHDVTAIELWESGAADRIQPTETTHPVPEEFPFHNTYLLELAHRISTAGLPATVCQFGTRDNEHAVICFSDPLRGVWITGSDRPSLSLTAGQIRAENRDTARTVAAQLVSQAVQEPFTVATDYIKWYLNWFDGWFFNNWRQSKTLVPQKIVESGRRLREPVQVDPGEWWPRML